MAWASQGPIQTGRIRPAPTSLRSGTCRPVRMWTRTLSTTISISGTALTGHGRIIPRSGGRGPRPGAGGALGRSPATVGPAGAGGRGAVRLGGRRDRRRGVKGGRPVGRTGVGAQRWARCPGHDGGHGRRRRPQAARHHHARHESADVGPERDPRRPSPRSAPATPGRRSAGARTRSPAAGPPARRSARRRRRETRATGSGPAGTGSRTRPGRRRSPPTRRPSGGRCRLHQDVAAAATIPPTR